MTPPVQLSLPDAAGEFVVAVVDHWAAVGHTYGLTLTHLRAIALLSRSAPMSADAMTRALTLSPSATAAAIRSLAAGGFLDRSRGLRNHSDTLRLTDGTIETLRLAPAILVETACDQVRLTPDDRHRIAMILLDLVEVLQRDTMRHRVEHEATRDDLVLVPARWM